jgi:hypothetical protein
MNNKSSFIKTEKGTDKEGRTAFIETPAKSNKTKVYIFGEDEIISLKELKGGIEENGTDRDFKRR